MRRFFVIAAVAVMGLSSCALAGRKEAVTVQDIPEAGRAVLSECFGESAVSAVLRERELFELEYEVMFADGAEIVFDRDGAWTKVDCRRSAVPETLLPEEMVAKVQASFPGSFIVEVERDACGYDAELNNGLELIFNRSFRMRIDD